MNILLIGEAYSQNLGDAVICNTGKKILEEYYPGAKITLFDMSGKIDFNKHYQFRNGLLQQKIMLKLFAIYFKFFPQSSLYKAFYQDELRHIYMLGSLNEICKKQTFDLVIFAGGELFMDYFSGIIYLIVKKLRKSKIIFHACGLGELQETSICLLRKVFQSSNVLSISLRDSAEKFKSLFGGEKLIADTYDIALNCNKYYVPNKSKCAEFGIGVIAHAEYYEFQKKLIEIFKNSEKSWKIFVNGSLYDENVARRILNDIGICESAQEKYILKRPENDVELIKTVTQFSNIISFRMHSQIIAAAFGIPSYGIVWDEKVKTFYEKIGLPKNCHIISENIKNLDFLDYLNIDKLRLRSIVETQAAASKELLINEVKKCLQL